MSYQVDAALVQAYHANIEIQFQQEGSLLRRAVRQETQNAEFDFYDRIGPTAAVKVTNRHSDTPLISTPHDRRRCALEDFDWADLIDRKDRIRMLADPTSPYVMNAVYALGRAMDDSIIEAFYGTAYTGKTGSGTQAPLPANIVAVDYVESGSAVNSDLTIGKLRNTREIIKSKKALGAGEKMYLACHERQITSLLQSTEVTSSDYNAVKALVQGEVNTFMGFEFIPLEDSMLPVSTGTIRRCFAWAQSGMLLATGSDITVDVGPRRDKRNSVQVYAAASFGAVRTWEEKVVELLCDESA